MPRRSAPGCVPLATVCSWLGIARGTQLYWVKKGLLRPTPSDGLQEADALDLAVLARLVSKFSLPVANSIWQELRPVLQQDSESPLFVIYEHGEPPALWIVRSEAQAKRRAFVDGSTRTVFILHPLIERIRTLFRQHAQFAERRGAVAPIGQVAANGA